MRVVSVLPSAALKLHVFLLVDRNRYIFPCAQLAVSKEILSLPVIGFAAYLTKRSCHFVWCIDCFYFLSLSVICVEVLNIFLYFIFQSRYCVESYKFMYHIVFSKARWAYSGLADFHYSVYDIFSWFSLLSLRQQNPVVLFYRE